jgi:hypothetical protein
MRTIAGSFEWDDRMRSPFRFQAALSQNDPIDDAKARANVVVTCD